MYLIPDFVDMAIEQCENKSWTTPDHRLVAVNSCIGNRSVTTMDTLVKNVKLINEIPEENIRFVTMDDLRELGCDL